MVYPKSDTAKNVFLLTKKLKPDDPNFIEKLQKYKDKYALGWSSLFFKKRSHLKIRR